MLVEQPNNFHLGVEAVGLDHASKSVTVCIGLASTYRALLMKEGPSNEAPSKMRGRVGE
jgi:hypothetical protein